MSRSIGGKYDPDFSWFSWNIPQAKVGIMSRLGNDSYLKKNFHFIINNHSNFRHYTAQVAVKAFNLLATDFFFQILARSVFKMWVIQKPNKVALWNKRHFEEKKWRLYSMFKIFSTDICWINIKLGIYRIILRPSYIYDARFLQVNVI